MSYTPSERRIEAALTTLAELTTQEFAELRGQLTSSDTLRQKVAELGGEPYVLADVLCHLYHDFGPTALTGFATDTGFVVSCAECKAHAQKVLRVIDEAMKP